LALWDTREAAPAVHRFRRTGDNKGGLLRMASADRVTRLLLSSPLTWLAVAAVIGLEAAFFAWFQPSLIMLAAALALGVLALIAWPVIFVRSGGFLKQLYRWTEDLESIRKGKMATLSGDFEELGFKQGTMQMKQLREKLSNLVEVLKRRLDAGEMTYGRYLSMAEQVYLSALDNLHEVAVALRSVSTIDRDHIRARLGELRNAGEPTPEQEQEFTALQHRDSLLEEQTRRATRLIAQNEAAMTVLDKTAAALAETRTGKGHADMDAEAAMAELEMLANRAGKYAVDA
jgi:hypothetical protein